MAPVLKRFMMASTGSTSSSGTGLRGLLESQQAAQRAQVLGLVVDQLRVLLEHLVVAGAAGVLQPVDRSRG